MANGGKEIGFGFHGLNSCIPGGLQLLILGLKQVVRFKLNLVVPVQGYRQQGNDGKESRGKDGRNLGTVGRFVKLLYPLVLPPDFLVHEIELYLIGGLGRCPGLLNGKNGVTDLEEVPVMDERQVVPSVLYALL